MYDVIIIGAGPAGTAAGFDLVSSGLSVLILDRHSFPRKKACAGGITPKAKNLFAYDISFLFHQTCHEIKVTCPHGDSFTARDKQPLCYMVQRKDLDAYSLNKVVSAGGNFKRISQVLSVESIPDKVVVNVAIGNGQKQYRARYVIGADGANSRVRTLLGLPKFKGMKYPALEADVRVERPGDYPMEFDFSRKISGYYWIFPKKDHVNIGIFGTGPQVPMNRALLKDYAKKRLGTDQLEAVKGYPIGTRGRASIPGQGRVLLTGDAAGFAEPLFGEGIYFALKSGRLAARAILQDRKNQADALIIYSRFLKPVRADLRFYDWGSKIFYRFPRFCLGLASHSLIHSCFSRAYAAGKPISRIFSPF
ncbi:MAG: geranylgeranyl reductase family protein [Desulfobacter sp.]|nr:geranylgeranyl reductase family protein [Desulfobacter sp.]